MVFFFKLQNSNHLLLVRLSELCLSLGKVPFAWINWFIASLKELCILEYLYGRNIFCGIFPGRGIFTRGKLKNKNKTKMKNENGFHWKKKRKIYSPTC